MGEALVTSKGDDRKRHTSSRTQPRLTADERRYLDFEIEFFEKVVRVYPDYFEALEILATDYTSRGDYEKGLATDLKLLSLAPHHPVVLYNLACSYSLTERIDEALETLSRAIQAGYKDFDYVAQDPDLENARRDPRFQQFLAGRYFSK